ncbi:MAG: hypothetical protein IKU26_02865 [Clostridia bacterium]|nr:hypothetical protein [Clostridia bacterium]
MDVQLHHSETDAGAAEQAEKEPIAPKRRMHAWEVVLLSVGAPIWLSLLLVLFAVVFALCVAFWSVIGSLWASFGALAGSVLSLIACGIIFICLGHEISGIALIGAGLVCTGLSIFFFIGCKSATKGAVWLTRVAVHGIKRCFVRKENV